MKPRIGVYLSEQMAARLAAAAKLPGASKSALVEAALAQFFGVGDEAGYLPADQRYSIISRQLEQLDRNLRVVNEAVALQARYHLAVTPPLPAAALRSACMLGSERFDEFAAQVGRRVRLGTSLMQETMDRLSTPKREAHSCGPCEGTSKKCSSTHEPDFRASNTVGNELEHSTAVREGGSLFNFPGKAGLPLH
jgi:hypothetical protein